MDILWIVSRQASEDVDGRTYLCAGDSRRGILWVFETFDDAREINRVAGAHCHQGDVARAKFKKACDRPARRNQTNYLTGYPPTRKGRLSGNIRNIWDSELP